MVMDLLFLACLLADNRRESGKQRGRIPNNPTSQLLNEFQQLPAGTSEAEDDTADGGRRPIEGDCAICFEEVQAAGGEELVWCRLCGNNLHTKCFVEWSKAKRSSSQTVTCVYCRAPWQQDTADGGGGAEGK